MVECYGCRYMRDDMLPKLYTYADILAYVPTPIDTMIHRDIERKYRRGYYAGVQSVLEALSRGVKIDALENWYSGSVFDWAYGGRYNSVVLPPKTPRKWDDIRKEILIRDEYTCSYCGRPARTVDHIIPRIRGGEDIESNLVAACRSCNSSKNSKTPDEWSPRWSRYAWGELMPEEAEHA